MKLLQLHRKRAHQKLKDELANKQAGEGPESTYGDGWISVGEIPNGTELDEALGECCRELVSWGH